jgi:pimeloyl-ACP methyl ester carboxylesterase
VCRRGPAVMHVSHATDAIPALGRDHPHSMTDRGSSCGVAGFRSRHVELDDVRLQYVIGGDGPTVVLLHGWAQSWWAWRRLMPALAERFTLVVPDLRGVGGWPPHWRSPGWRSADPRTFTAMTEQGRTISSRSRAVEIGPAGHWVLQEQPQQILDALLPHMAERGGPR